MHTLSAHVSREYRDDTPATQHAIGDDIILGITGVGTFISIQAAILAFAPLNATYGGKITLAKGGAKIDIDDRDLYWTTKMLPAMDDLADSVDGIAKGSKTIVDLSRFPCTITETTSSVIPVALVIDVQGGVAGSGTLVAESKTKIDAKAYLTIALETGTGTVTKTGDQITITFTDASGRITGVANLLLSTSKKGTISATRKTEQDVLEVGVNGKGVGPLSNKASVIVP